MALIAAISQLEKTTHNSHKFAFKLSPTNYGFWKSMLEAFFTTHGLFGYIDGTIPCPPKTVPSATTSDKNKDTPETQPETQPNPNHMTWVANDAHVRMILMSSISEASFQHVQGTTSRDLWLSLERAYAPHTSSREFTLKTQLLKIQMNGDETPFAYVDRAQEYSDALANIEELMKEKDLVMLVISDLREEYNGFKSNLVGRPYPAFLELKGLLSDYDYMIKKPIIEPSPVQAFMARAHHPSSATNTTSSIPNDTLQALQQLVSKLGLQLQPATNASGQNTQSFYTSCSNNNNNNTRGRTNTNRGRGRGNNYNNNRGGVTRSQFPWASNENTVYGTCNRCGIGHIPAECPNRDPSTIRPRPNANYADTRSQTTSAWLPDTGSSNHVTPSLSGFDTFEPYFGSDNLHVGNGHYYPQYPPHGTK